MSETLVLGLGNLLLGDEGFGVHAIARMRERFVLPDEVDLVDGGTLGLALLPALEDAHRIILIDVVELGQPPGTLAVLGWDDLPRALHIKLSPHQQTIQEALGWLEFRHGRPREFVAIGVQPKVLDVGLALSPPVEAALDLALDQVRSILEAWGYRIEPRTPIVAPAGRDVAERSRSASVRFSPGVSPGSISSHSRSPG